jgi:hypothetical protein
MRGANEWPGRKLMRTHVELNRNDAFGLRRSNAEALRMATGKAMVRSRLFWLGDLLMYRRWLNCLLCYRRLPANR